MTPRLRRSHCECNAPVPDDRWFWCSDVCRIAAHTERVTDAQREARRARRFACPCGRALPPRIGSGGVRRHCEDCTAERQAEAKRAYRLRLRGAA